jgi:hypothetical protein
MQSKCPALQEEEGMELGVSTIPHEFERLPSGGH